MTEPDSTAAQPKRPPRAEPFTARLVKARTLTPSVREMTFERTDGRPMDFFPGQWVSVMLPQVGDDFRRSYSIASEPNGTGRFDIAVTRVADGPGSSLLHAMEPGATINAIGPSGLFTRDETDPSVALFVGTGTGITPFRSMIRASIAAGATPRMRVLIGVRHEEDILYRSELEEIARAHPSIDLFVTLSQPGPDWTGRKGYVQEHVPELWKSLESPEGHIYICGLERMVKTVRELARTGIGLDRKHVHQERYD
jgi:CDP-4-dehydro-6-deoxyglucose reductase, E3